MTEKTIFEKIINGEISASIIAETDLLIVIKDIYPKAPIHLLIIPKKPVRDVQSLTRQDIHEIVPAMFSMAQYLGETLPGAAHFKLHINAGRDAGQEVPHLHMHFLAGFNAGVAK